MTGDHTATPTVDLPTWRLRLHGSGLRGTPTADRPIELSYRDLRRLPAQELSAFIECAGNGRSFYTTQQGQTVTGTPLRLGAVGVTSARCAGRSRSRRRWTTSCSPTR